MITKKQGLDVEALEAMVDRHALAGVLEMLAHICGEKAEHVQSNWQDHALAERWEKAAGKIEKVAGEVTD